MGFAMSLEHDGLLLTALGAFTDPFLAAICNDGPQVFIVTLDPAGCAGVNIGVVYGLTCDVFLQFPVETPVVTVSYETVPDGLIGVGSATETDLVWTNGCGAQNTVVVVGGTLNDADFVNGTITLLPVSPPDFVRGDCNADGGVDVGDSIWILSELFLQGPKLSVFSFSFSMNFPAFRDVRCTSSFSHSSLLTLIYSLRVTLNCSLLYLAIGLFCP